MRPRRGSRGWGWGSWPIEPANVAEGARGDAIKAGQLAEYLELDGAGWGCLVWKANRLARRSDFRRLVVAIANELERGEVLDAAELRTLMPDTEAAAAA